MTMPATKSLLAWKGRPLNGGTLVFRMPGGRAVSVGDGRPRAVLRLRDHAVLARILRDPELALGETYVDGGWEPEEGDLLGVLEVCMRLAGAVESRGPLLRTLLGRWGERNGTHRSRRNVNHHYDRDPDLYRGFLDRDMHYSCAYFATANLDLDGAQEAKCALIARKLRLQPGAHVLDIGCGFGGLALHLARRYGVRVLGITLSHEQLREAEARTRERGLTGQVTFRLLDYRQVFDKFDAVVSVGMFEHVGRPQYETYFGKIHELLTDTGVALVHTIGRSTPPAPTNPWIRRYIFPGGHIPAASEMTSAVERSNLCLTDLEIWRGHYATTLHHWHTRFQHRRAEFVARFGERFCRLWEFYLQSSEAAFRWGGLVVFQAQLARDPFAVPLTRDYLYGGDEARAGSVVHFATKTGPQVATDVSAQLRTTRG
jgi:cyclopropane-fatty-acyl-phospholipid synthase